MAAQVPVLVRLTGRCANGAERDGGRLVHVVLLEQPLASPRWGRALCGKRGGRLSNGFEEVDGAEVPTCPTCRRRALKDGGQ